MLAEMAALLNRFFRSLLWLSFRPRTVMRSRLRFSPTLTQQNGDLHAGAITAVPDSACGYAALTVAADDKEILTVEFKVNLLAPAAGEVFAARAQVKKAGRTLTVCSADAFAISDGGAKVLATMLATIMAVPITAAK